jgi:hypothetical protein
MTMMSRDSFPVYQEYVEYRVVSRRGYRVLAPFAEALSVRLPAEARNA